MCGIAGFYHERRLPLDAAATMAQALAHRGPDGQKTKEFPQSATALAHRRLAILDLTDQATQPMTYGDSGLWIVYNGEIFNYIELRAELKNQGFHFRTESDTEVVLAAYIHWGEAAFHRLNGMWAMAIYDENQNSLLLCLDRFGIKPLYYATNAQGGCVFASELKSFLAIHRHVPARWSDRGLATALLTLGGLEAAGKTVFESVDALRGGQLIRFSSGQAPRIIQWWATGEQLTTNLPATLDTQALHFKELLFDACRIRLRSDVPIATSLSGGLDSSSIVAVLSKLRDAPQFPHKVFIHRFPGTVHDETAYAEQVIQGAGLQPVWVTANETELFNQLDSILFSYESIYPGIPDAPWRIYKTEREHGIRVSLDGHGADEYLGGYYQYVLAALWAALPDPKKTYSYVRQYQEQSGAFFSWKGLLAGVARVAIGGDDSATVVQWLKQRTNPVLGAFIGQAKPFEPLALKPLSAPWVDPVNGLLYEDFHRRVLPRILKNFDLMSMANGIEVRMPFMDYRLVTFAFSLGSESKLGGGYTKLVLREAMKGLLPEAIRTRKLKLGFNSPLQTWLPGPLKPWVEDTLSQPSPLDHLIDRQRLTRYFRERVVPKQAPWTDVVQFWKFVSALRWAKLVETRLWS
jgi:asparagine synthase (glutamine-hydrolysing)